MYGTPQYVPLSLPKVPGAFDNQKLAYVLLDEITKYKSTYDMLVKDFHKHMKDYAGNRFCIIYNINHRGSWEDMF